MGLSHSPKPNKMKPFSLVVIALLFGSCFFQSSTSSSNTTKVELKLQLDQEKMLNPNKALNSGTQSINRYHSVLRSMDKAAFSHHPENQTIDIHLQQDGETQLGIYQLETQFLVPLLPYAHPTKIDDFDKANLLLAEFARNGIQMSYQENNTSYGFFNSTANIFNQEGEYRYVNQKIEPNSGVRPVRMSVVNNCLHPGLWELNATDAVGEMYHSWLKLPDDFYFNLIRNENNVATPVEELQAFFKADNINHIPVDLERLRSRKKLLQSTTATIAGQKEIGGYSSQDSRRKVQRGFFQILKNGQPDAPKHFEELLPEHTFSLHAFIPPGIYDNTQSFDIPYRPDWKKVDIYEVTPLTSYGYPANEWQNQGSLEIVLHSEDGKRAIIAGNIPVSLLVFGADYSIPAFGAGVLSSSELIERRHLRLREGPLPHYAYLTQVEGENLTLLNNHTEGYEQIFFRPFLKGQEMYLRMTVVSYERVIDLLEFEIPITGALKDRILQAERRYQPPAYQVYSDNNVL